MRNLIKQILKEEIQLDNLSKLSRIIRDKYPHINQGGCAVFARAFHKITGFPYMLIFDTGLTDEDPPIHVMVELPNGSLYDGEGVRTKQEVEDYYEYDVEGLDFMVDDDGSLLDTYYDELGEGLFTHCHKEDYDDIYKVIEDTL